MKGPDLKPIRHERGLSTTEMGRALGYTGTDKSVASMMRRLEAGMRPLPPRVALRLIELGWYQPTRQAVS